jgi:hypothetical protein
MFLEFVCCERVRELPVCPRVSVPEFPSRVSDDPFGLYTIKGFPADKEAQLRKALDDAIAKLSESCPSCAGSLGPKVANALQGATFVYHPKSKYCGDTGPFSVLRFHHVVALGDLSFGSRCESLTCTVAHEGVHLLTHGDKKAYGLEKSCFGCQH